MLNKTFLMGRFVRTPELRRTQSGTAVTAFSLAVERDFKASNGEKGVDFVDCVAWRGTAEFVTKYFSKGRMAVVEGRLQMHNWVDDQGNKRTKAQVVAENVYFADSKQGGATPAPSAPSAPPNNPYGGFTPMPSEFGEIEECDGDLPY